MQLYTVPAAAETLTDVQINVVYTICYFRRDTTHIDNSNHK